ncbi:MAG: thiamine pyrophosphate-dependent dehydrogenase E1 component subunit alpha [Chloroflexi bacterium]|nr:thiamine pyrophosphate-dependent dehydrogenase E1 component subunit alpha [Chloroflexota bacterium]
MLAIRTFEQKAEELLNRGEILGSMHSSIGQEAVCVGGCMAVRPDDYMTGHHRSHGHPIAKGADLKRLMAELLGRVTGVCHGKGGSMHLADFSVGSLGEAAIVGSSLPIAAGAGLAIKLSGSGKVCLAFFGDGASNTGIFHEALNLASIWKLPVVFLCENNQYAITTSIKISSAVQQIAHRASAYAMPGQVVDGQDVLAVHAAVRAAADRARAGEGPTLVEAMTYRYGEHSTRLRLPLYRSAEEVEAWKQRDPIVLFRGWIVERGLATADELAHLEDAVKADVEAAVEFAHQSPYPDLDSLWDDMYADPSPWRERPIG